MNLRLDWCSFAAARYACENWHYSKTIPKNKSNYIGVWEDGKFIGVVIFGLGASPSLGNPYGLTMFQCSELTRIALSNHKSQVSRIVAIAIRILYKKNPGLRMLVSFADSFHGHYGGIYQAGGWIYSGKTSAGKMVRLKTGAFADLRRYNGHGHNKKSQLPVGSDIISTPPKFRYLKPLDNEMAGSLEKLRRPYPKKNASEVKGDTPVDQAGKGGSTPTRTLHS